MEQNQENITDNNHHNKTSTVLPSRYILSGSGLFKMLAMILFIASIVIFFNITTCSGTPIWYQYLFPCTIGINTILLLICYSISLSFNLHSTQHCNTNNKLWNFIDIILTMMTILLILLTSILTIATCKDGHSIQHIISPPLAIIGTICLGINIAFLFKSLKKFKNNTIIMDEDESNTDNNIRNQNEYRKSVLA